MGKLEVFLNKDPVDDMIVEKISSKDIFDKFAKMGDSVGLKVRRSDTIFEFLISASNKERKLVMLAFDYIVYAGDTQKQKEITAHATKIARSMDKKEIVDLAIEMDRRTIGVMSRLSAIITSVFGLNISTYKSWKSNRDATAKEIEDGVLALEQLGGYDKEVKVMRKIMTKVRNS